MGWLLYILIALLFLVTSSQVVLVIGYFVSSAILSTLFWYASRSCEKNRFANVLIGFLLLVSLTVVGQLVGFLVAWSIGLIDYTHDLRTYSKQDFYLPLSFSFAGFLNGMYLIVRLRTRAYSLGQLQDLNNYFSSWMFGMFFAAMLYLDSYKYEALFCSFCALCLVVAILRRINNPDTAALCKPVPGI